MARRKPQAPAGKANSRIKTAYAPWEGRLARKLLLPMAAVAFALLSIYGVITYQKRLEGARREARLLAEAIERQVIADRRYYTQNVVPVVKKANVLVTNHYRREARLAVPLPTTYVREVAEGLSKTATTAQYQLALLSLFPINPKQGPRSEAERELMKVNFQRHTKESQLDRNGDQSSFTLYIPDFANAESCVTCHNAHPESPKKDYALGDVMGSLAITIPMTERMRQVWYGTLSEVAIFTSILVVAGGLIWFQAQRTVLRPVRDLATTATELAAGNLAAHMQHQSDDELGRLTEAFSAMTSTVRQVVDREVASRQAMDHAITQYLEYLEAVSQGDLRRRLPPEHNSHESRQMAVLGEQINRLVDQLRELVARSRAVGDHLNGAPAGEELSEAVSQMRAAAGRFRM